ncbi:ATP-dependent zinc metalloprotease FtsH [Herbidospora sp. NBRC 101105]|uniref:ATP-dependent zinc metalloprotease FtsH n=1 Tax=Herbidospora sp. NBRC 101105 TaxID=3032195 RepID=UPI0024A5D9A0|nr:ATP-dependent zinc metalloprotease FtsH [Herbidospora sp. NBRC 101105]GLX94717.1 ATP-dependent zinc metalloprotease FtsH [Herbidospora sp. NBRC 101105]
MGEPPNDFREGDRERPDSRPEKSGDEAKPWRSEGLPPPRPNRPKINWWRFALTMALTYAAFFIVSSFFDGEPRQTISYTEFARQVNGGNVKDIYATGTSIQGNLKKAQPIPGDKQKDTFTKFATVIPVFADQEQIYQQLTQQNVTIQAEPTDDQRGTFWNLVLSLLPILLLAGVWVWLMRRAGNMMGGGGGLGGIGRNRAAKPVESGKVRVDFSDVAGIDEVENELIEIVDYLKEPGKYRRLGAKLPKGVLLTGPPGTGKTLLARAVAGEASVPFFSASASEFIEMIVGVGASRVRELFDEARKVAPSIVFIDEIDAIGRTRGASTIGGHDEREQTLNQVLTEMDGFTGNEGVIVIAATNRPEVLDAALLRPGRFDRNIVVAPPDQQGRIAILRVHTRGVPLSPAVQIPAIAKSTPGMTGADLANLVNEAALLAARRGHTAVSPADFADALEKLQLGTARAIVMPEEERTRTAYHEAGHALLGMLLPGADPVRKISIIPRGRALGVTLSTPEDDRYAYDERYLRGRITGALGGMAAEQVVFGIVTTGAENDLEQVTSIARGMVGRWGMSPLIGPLTILPTEGPPQAASATLASVDDEARRIVDECYADAQRLISDNRHRLEGIVAALLDQETLDEADAYAAAGLTRD